ncbi:nucleotidyltransferase domain-containing protein [Hydrogenivirga sp.]
MPVRSLSSPVLRWVPEGEVIRAFSEWAKKICRERNDVVRVGFFGSYARGDWGVGSDLDVIVVLKHSSLPFWKRAIEFDTTALPVPVDLFVYTTEEINRMRGTKFYREVIEREALWVDCHEPA